MDMARGDNFNKNHQQRAGAWNRTDTHRRAARQREAAFWSKDNTAHTKDREEFPRLTHAPVILEPKTQNYCTEYAQQVVNRDIMAGPHVRAACRRHLNDLERADRGDPLWFDKGAYDHFAGFCERWLRFYSGQFDGQPFVLESSQEFIWGNIFGWRMWRSGYPEDKPWTWPRRFRRCYLEIGKGNGKTPSMAAAAIYGLLADKEPGAEIYIGASKQKQAHVCFDDAVKMLRHSPIGELVSIKGVSPAYRVDHLPSESWIDVLSGQSKNSESGIKPHFAMLDEVHEHPDNLLIDMMQRGFKWRRQPLLIMSTNSGWDMTSAAGEEHEHGRKVVHGEVQSDESFAYICGMDAGDEPLKDRSVWPKANPLLGVAQTVESLDNAVADAVAYPSRVNNILRLHFCQWTEGETAWISKDAWERIESPRLNGLRSIEGRPTILAIDLSQKHDTTGLTYIAPVDYTDEGKEIFAAVCRAYLPAENLREKIDHDKRPYDAWAREYPDMMRLTEGPVVEHADVVNDIIDDMELIDLKAVVYDAFFFDQFARLMAMAGFPEDIPLVEHPQGWNKRRNNPLSMSISIGVLEKFIQTHRILVERNPVLRAAVAGARQLASPSGQARWDKAASQSRIDVLVSLTMGCGAWDIGPENLIESTVAANKKDRLREFWRAASTGGVDFAGLSA